MLKNHTKVMMSAFLLLVGCSDNNNPTPTDTRINDVARYDAKIDQPINTKSDQQMIVDTTAISDSHASTDKTSSSSCTSECQALEPSLCLPNPDNSEDCIECTEDSHCKNNPGAFGPVCDKTNRICVCKGDSDCTANGRGKKCYLAEGMCTCEKDSECGGTLSACLYNVASAEVKICQAPKECTTSCAANEWQKVCDRAKGSCEDCAGNVDCTPETLGNQCWKRNIGSYCSCNTSDDCINNIHGHYCNQVNIPPFCSCRDENDCPSPKKCTGVLEDTEVKICQ